MSQIDQIQTFIAVASHGSFAEASRQLSLSTSAVSARVQALEKRLGVRLLQRSTRSLRLTDEGRRYFDHCRETLQKLQDVEEALAQRAEPSGGIRLSVPTDLAMAPFARTLAEFRERYPKVVIDVHSSDETVDLIRDPMDLAIRGRAPGSPELIARPLGEGKLAMVVSAALYRDHDESEIRELPLLDPLDLAPQVPQLAGWQRSAVHSQHIGLARQLCLQSQGTALLPVSFCRDDIQHGRLQPLPLAFALPTLPLYLVYPNRRQQPARLRAFIDFLLDNLATFPLV